LFLLLICLLQFVLHNFQVEKKERKEGNDKKGKDEDFRSVVNPSTRKETSAFGDPNMRNLKRGNILQLERKGCYRCDVPFLNESKPIFFNPRWETEECFKVTI